MPSTKKRASNAKALRPPAVPLVTMDPYLSCWSMADHLYDDTTKHWTGKPHSLTGIIRVDGKALKFMGGSMFLKNTAVQKSVQVRPTQTVYVFACGGVDLELTFTTPLLMDDLDLLSRPVTYVTFGLAANDGKVHDVQVYFEASAEWAVNVPSQDVTWGRGDHAQLDVAFFRSREQEVLGHTGDDIRIDWGTLYVAVPKSGVGVSPAILGRSNNMRGRDAHGTRGQDAHATALATGWTNWDTCIATADAARGTFVDLGVVPGEDYLRMPCPANSLGGPVVAAVLEAPLVDKRGRQGHLMIAYDDEFAIEYFGRKLRAWWRRKPDACVETLLTDAHHDYAKLMERCRKFDRELLAQARAAGGAKYADLCGLTYRQAIAAHKLVASPKGEPLWFSKENNSNGCICTVDVTYPSAPLFLLYNTALVKGMCDPIFDYCGSKAWKEPFAAHDLGQYPKANGQVYGWGGKLMHMPVEECGNMIILAAAVVAREGTPAYAKRHWKLLSTWADYLRQKGLDPEEQLCTDDFAGHLARNANLSIKAIVALGCYGRMADKLGLKALGAEYTAVAKAYAKGWEAMAADGDHYRLAFDKAGSWSMKYNLVWDRLLGLGLFDPKIARTEIAYYKKIQNEFGLPLDSRKAYTKSDWILWMAVAAESRKDFEALVDPVWHYADRTPSREALSDWHDTKTGKFQAFKARSVVGGFFMRLLAEKLKRI